MATPEDRVVPMYTGSRAANIKIADYLKGYTPEERLAELVSLYGEASEEALHLVGAFEMQGSKTHVRGQRDYARRNETSLRIRLTRFTEPIPLAEPLDNSACAAKLVVNEIFERKKYHARFTATQRLASIGLQFFDEANSRLNPRHDMIISAPANNDPAVLYFGGKDLMTMHGILLGMRQAKKPRWSLH